MSKITMKIPETIHRKLRTVQGLTGDKTLYDVINRVIDSYIEIINKKR